MLVVLFHELMKEPKRIFIDKNSEVLDLLAKDYTVYNVGTMQVAHSVKGELFWKDVQREENAKSLPDYSSVA